MLDISNELEQAWNNLQAVPAYTERYAQDDVINLVVVEYCSACGHWHDLMDECPVLVEA